MATPGKLSIVYYSSTGTIAEIAKELHNAGVKAGAEVRLVKAAELAPQAAIEANPVWAANHAATVDIPEAPAAPAEASTALPQGAGLSASKMRHGGILQDQMAISWRREHAGTRQSPSQRAGTRAADLH
ncbi:flavodoxin domain-containing protein [Saccharopolyspora shandongensis]|uniref:flavodoxin domain-containing protein n=1 Tax=Saccharopolyspora shandongensis TaxID=418495 RepID=UPI0033E4D0D9